MVQDRNGAILLVAFGTSLERAAQAVDFIAAACEKAFPGWAIHHAYASSGVRNILKERGNRVADLLEALAGLAGEGLSRVLVQPLCVLPGRTFEFVVEVCQHFATMRRLSGDSLFTELRVGKPLIRSLEDCKTILDLLQALYSPEALAESEALVFVGHGSDHVAGAAYSALHLMAQERFGERVLFGVIEGFPSFFQIVRCLERVKVRRVTIVPFMLVAGVHIVQDIAGRDDSWKSQLEDMGFEVSVVFRGLGEEMPFVELFLQRIREAMGEGYEGRSD